MNDTLTTQTFALLDAAMIDSATAFIPSAPERYPDWLIPIYQGATSHLGPLLIDMTAADLAGDSQPLQAMLCARLPRLHLSLIETALTQAELAVHLRQFIFFSTEDGNHFALRFADCRVLPALAHTFGAAQWAALTQPLQRWRVRERDGSLVDLPLAVDTIEAVIPPLVLSDAQIEALTDDGEPDQLIFSLHHQYPGKKFSGSVADHYRWAKQCIVLWKAAGDSNRLRLLELGYQVFLTRGALLNDPELPPLLARQARQQKHDMTNS